MVRTRLVVVSGAVLAALAGCSSGTAPASAPAVPAPSPSDSIDAGTLQATGAYLTALGRLDQKLVGDRRAALDRGLAACVDIEERRTDAEQQKNIAARVAVDAAQAKKILELTKANLCLE
jgi:hypothetical protein